MTVYARSDVSAVSISKDHGGCGQIHSRPVVEGAPAKIWALSCQGGCENFLRSDSLWSGTAHTIPETPDETARRTDIEKRGQVEQQTSMAHALNDLAKLGALPGVLAQLMGHLNPNADKVEAATLEQELRVCRNGHMNQQHVKFCGECGANMLDAVNKQPTAALSSSETASPTETGVTVTPAEPQAETGIEDLESKSLTELREIARDLGAEIARSKAEQIDNIVKARAK
jgi:Transcription termination factor